MARAPEIMQARTAPRAVGTLNLKPRHLQSKDTGILISLRRLFRAAMPTTLGYARAYSNSGRCGKWQKWAQCSSLQQPHALASLLNAADRDESRGIGRSRDRPGPNQRLKPNIFKGDLAWSP